MKDIPVFFGVALLLIFLGCSPRPVALSTVGPNPSGLVGTTTAGQLEVFSATTKRRDGNEFDINPAWYQHTDYSVYDLTGKRIRHVFNNTGHYEEAPRVISLPVGKYLVKAHAKGYLDVVVPVRIEPGRTTRVHLDGQWTLATKLPAKEIVSTPGGYPVGWRTDAANHVGMN